MSLVDFRHRKTKPSKPVRGSFYWVDNPEVGTQLWFAPDTNPDSLILLNGELAQSVKALEMRIDSNDADIDEIKTMISDIVRTAVKKSDIPTKVSQLKNDAEYAKKSELNDYIKFSDLEGYAEDDDLAEYAKKDDLDAYALKVDIPDVPTKVSELENDSGYLTKHQSLAGYAKTSDLKGYVKKSELPELPTKVSELENDSSYVTSEVFEEKMNELNAKTGTLSWKVIE